MQVDFLGNLGAFHWENPNPNSCFYLKAANSLLKQTRPTYCKIKKQEKNLLEEKLADLAPLSSDKKKIKTKSRNSSNLQRLSITRDLHAAQKKSGQNF